MPRRGANAAQSFEAGDIVVGRTNRLRWLWPTGVEATRIVEAQALMTAGVLRWRLGG
ncbi:hypothetical protein [Ferrimicrobium sp.]|uniref:hypothetical protein n=1 Tax=Ferrimicrobium sp. TaxID=2926050 RepID=UPI00262CB70E|nr:hypothetical protein [Ferrimicrobium sp.]